MVHAMWLGEVTIRHRQASSLLSFRDQYEVLRWLHIQLGTLLVADHHRFSAAAFAKALIRCARQNPLDARKIRSQFLPAWMLGGSFRRAMDWLVLSLRRLDHFTDNGRKVKQLHLIRRKFFSARSILLDPHQPQSLFQQPNP
jgi:hypothetical protein